MNKLLEWIKYLLFFFVSSILVFSNSWPNAFFGMIISNNEHMASLYGIQIPSLVFSLVGSCVGLKLKTLIDKEGGRYTLAAVGGLYGLLVFPVVFICFFLLQIAFYGNPHGLFAIMIRLVTFPGLVVSHIINKLGLLSVNIPNEPLYTYIHLWIIIGVSWLSFLIIGIILSPFIKSIQDKCRRVRP